VKKLLISMMFSLLCASSAGGQTAPDHYRGLVQRLKSGDRTVDFTEFRMSFVNSPEYRGPDKELLDRAKAALDAHHYEELLSIAGRMLDENYADVRAHFDAYRAHKELGHKDEAAYHRFIYEGLLNSIEKSGDGKSHETAYVVISMNEVLLPVFRDQIKKETRFEVYLIDEGAHHWCTFEGVDARANQRFVLFFNVDIPVNRIKDTLTKKKTVGTT
jgi:hypothetical protein